MTDELSIRHQIDLICDRFEQALKDGGPVDIEDFLDDVATEHQELLRDHLQQLLSDYRARESKSGFEPTIAPDSVTAPDLPPSASDDVTLDSQTVPNEHQPLATDPTATDTVTYFGDYELLGEIARGGMGVVYRARQTSLGRVVALKMILSGQLAGSREIARFQSEAEAAATLDHPGIVPIYEVGRHKDCHYFSMGFVDGPSLSETLREGPLEPRIAAAKLSQIADAVDYAHARGVIHRDLKPGNVLLDTRGEPHITDFGLAKRMQADTELTTSGEVLGTPAYMPPEQARGDLEAIGPTSDVYSLGAILYAMLSGRPPHSAPSMAETLRQVIETEALSVRSLSPSTPKDLETICATCLAKEPAKRYASAGALRDELDRFLEGKPIQARPVTPVERLWRWAKRHPVPAVLSAALVLLLATLAIGGPLTAINQNRLKQAAQRNEARANQLAASERDARDRSNRSLYARTISLAFQELQTGNLFGAEDLLGSLPSSQRGFEWRYVQSLCHQELESFFGLNALAYSVEVAPDGVHVMAMARGNQPRVCSWQSGDDLPRQTRNVYGIAISTDGSKMAIADASDNNGFQIVDSVTGEVQQTFAGHERGVGFADFGGPDDSMIATVGRDKTVRIWDVASGKQLLVIRVPYRQRLHPVALSPDGSLVAWSRGDDGGIEIRKTSNGNIIFESLSRNTFKGNDTPVEFSPDGSLLAVGGFGEVLLLDPQTGDDLGSLHGTRAKSYGFDFSPDGKRLVVGSEDGMVRVFDVDRRRLLTTMTGHKVGASYGVIAVAFDGSGDRIVSSGFNGVVKVWDAWNGDRREAIDDARSDAEGPRPSQSVDFVATMPEATQRLRFADDGSVLLAAGSGDTAAMIDPNNGDVIRKWKDLPGNQGAIDYHASSHRMVVGGGSILDRWPGEVRLLDAISGDLVWKFDDTRGPISGLRFFDDGKRIAVGVGSQNANTGGVLVLETQSGELQWRNPSSMLPVRDLDVSPDGATIATVGHDDGVTLWNATTGEKEKTLGDRVFYSVAFASDGQKIAVGSVDWSVRLFEINSSDLIWTSRRHTGAVMQLAFTENDTRLVSTALDGHTRIWDTRYGDSVLAMRDSDLANLSLAVAPDASAIAVSGFNPTIALRRIPKNIATQSEVVDANAPASDEWVTLVEDDFERDQLGDGWKPSGSWEIVDGVACGTLAPTPYGPGLNAANLASTTMVSSDFEVSFDAWIDQPMIAEAKVSDIAVQHAISSLFVGVVKSPINRSEKGVAVSHLIHRSFREVGSRRDGPFQFEVDRKYRFRTRRDGDRIELWIDNESYRTVQLSDQTPMPMMSIQGIFGPVGSKIYVDNVLIKVPRDGLAESVAADLVVKAFESAKIKPLVINAIRNADVSEFGDDPMATRTAALKLASRWPQENDEILAKIETLARKDEVPADDYQAMLDWVQGSIPSQNDRGNRVASMCAFRLNDRTIAWEMTKQANQKHVREHGYRHPIDLAIPGMMLNQNNAEIAVANLRQLREIMRSDHWRKNQQATAWAKEAEQRIQSPPEDPSDQVLADRVWDHQYSLLIRGDVEPLAASLAPDARRILMRAAGEDDYRHTDERADWIRSERIGALGGRRSLGELTRTDCTINSNEKTSTVTSHFHMEAPETNYSWVQQDVFQRQPDQPPESWEIREQNFRVTWLRFDDEVHHVDRYGWRKFDDDVDTAKQTNDPRELLFSLMAASRVNEALDVAKKAFTQSEDANIQFHLAEIAQWCAETDVLTRAMKKAVELDPLVGGSPAIRALAARKYAAETPMEFATGATVRPPSFYRPGPRGLLAAGSSGLAAWQVTDDSLIGIVQMPFDANTAIDQLAKTIIESRKEGFAAKLIWQGASKVDDCEAYEFVVRSLGIGRAAQMTGRPTVQRFTLIDRPASADVTDAEPQRFLVFVSAYENDFEDREAEYHEFLQTMRLK